MEAATVAPVRALTILNMQGDVTIVWEEADDEKMIPVIEKKMKEGIVFFLIEPRFGGLAGPKKTRLTRSADAVKHRALSIRDEDFSGFIEASQTAEPVKTPDATTKTVRKARTAREVAKGESVGVRQMTGG